MFIVLIIVVCELLFTESCLMIFVAHSKTDFVPFYFIHCETLEQHVDTNCCLRENLVIKKSLEMMNDVCFLLLFDFLNHS